MEYQPAPCGLKESTISRIRSVFARYPQVERVKIDLSVLREIDNAALLEHIERVGVIFYGPRI